MKHWQIALFGALCLLLLSPPAWATRHRRPFEGVYRITAGYDNKRNASGCVDYGCGSRCYNEHSGTDYGMPVGTPVRASASGTVVARNDGCANYGYYGNTCGGRCGNYVKLRHADGTHTIYCHMRLGGVAVGNGQRVECGQVVGYSASSGSSTGPHLHHGWQPSSSQEPYVGSCGRRGSAVWVQQNGYSDLPSTQCETSCACSPGQQERRGCGNCGTQTRTCGSNCQWGGWGGCDGQGVCAAGSTQSEPCCDCGQRTRRCNGSCQWDGWGDCGGPDPSPAQACATGKPGVCAQGTQRCLSGCLSCVEDTKPSDELCDALDNDCDGTVDNGAPKEFGATRPVYSALVKERSLPNALIPGERATAWFRVENTGAQAWEPGEVIVRATSQDPKAVASLITETWAAHDIPARLEQRVEPGEVATFAFGLETNTDAFEGAQIDFVVSVLGVGPMMCPDPGVQLEVASLRIVPNTPKPPVQGEPQNGADSGADHADATADSDAQAHANESGCAATGSTRAASPWLGLFGLLFVAMHARRRRRA